MASYTAHLLDDTVTGSATYVQSGSAKKPVRTFDVVAKSERLDADRLLLDEAEIAALGGKRAGAAPAGGGGSGPAPEPPKDPHSFDGLRGEVKAEVAALRYSKMDLNNTTLAMKMVDDAVTVQSFRAALYGGQVSAQDTTVRLGPAEMPFDAKVKVESVDVGRALAARTDKKVLAGIFSGDFALKGAGTEPDLLKQTLQSPIPTT